MYPTWRWDQGRLMYFEFEKLRAIANILVKFDGISLTQEADLLRDELVNATGMPFAPAHYKVWRNYKRVFECSFLATNIGDKLVVTDFCKQLSSNPELDVDAYLASLIPRFRFPFPAFSEYSNQGTLVYPFCAVLKFLVSNLLLGKDACVSLDDVFSVIIGNKCTGTEPVEYYVNLQRTRHQGEGDSLRQVREMLIFISQMSVLKWNENALRLDIFREDYNQSEYLRQIITPIVVTPRETKEEEYLQVTSLAKVPILSFDLISRETSDDISFTEGRKIRVTHLKIERSPLLRKLYFQKQKSTVCDMCIGDMKKRYPWTKNILEVHHILPLSSALPITPEGTSLEDVVGICPNCHRSVHAFYKSWLSFQRRDDFNSRDEARSVFLQAKERITA